VPSWKSLKTSQLAAPAADLSPLALDEWHVAAGQTTTAAPCLMPVSAGLCVCALLWLPLADGTRSFRRHCRLCRASTIAAAGARHQLQRCPLWALLVSFPTDASAVRP